MRWLRPAGYMMAGAALAIGAYNLDSAKQGISYFLSQPAKIERLSGAAKLAAAEREYEEKQKMEVGKAVPIDRKEDNKAATEAKEEVTYKEPICSSDYSGFNRVQATVNNYGSGDVLCAFETGMDDKKESVAAIRSEGKGLTFIAKYGPGGEQFKEYLSHGSKLERFEIVDFSGEASGPFIAAVGSKGREKELLVLTYNGHKVAHTKGIGFDFRDTSNSGRKDLIAVGMPDRAGLVHVYQWYPAANIPAGGMFSSEAFRMSVDAAKHHLTLAIKHGNAGLIRQVQNANNTYAFITALDGAVRETMPHTNVSILYSELFETEPIVFLQRLLSDPMSINKWMLAATFAERFVHHVNTRNDHMIGYDAGRGYKVTFDGQVYSGYRSMEEARQAVSEMERRKQDEANRPRPVYTFKEYRNEPGGGASEKRTTVIGPSKTPAQWETERRVREDPVARRAEEAYHRAGAIKGDAERKAGEAARSIGKALEGVFKRK